MNGDGPPQSDSIPLRQQRSTTVDTGEKPVYWASGSPQSTHDDGSSIRNFYYLILSLSNFRLLEFCAKSTQ
jgi:hypothetical protein